METERRADDAVNRCLACGRPVWYGMRRPKAGGGWTHWCWPCYQRGPAYAATVQRNRAGLMDDLADDAVDQHQRGHTKSLREFAKERGGS